MWQDGGKLKVTAKQLQEWFERADEGGDEPREWERVLCHLFGKWQSTKKPLPVDEVDFLVTSFTALYKTLEGLLEAGKEARFDFQPHIEELQSAMAERLFRQSDSVVKAWRHLGAVVVRQFHEAYQARKRGQASTTKTLKEFYAALNAFKQAMKQHSDTPGHRQLQDPERDRTIRRMRRGGKTYGQIAQDLPKLNTKWRVTPKAAERLDKRHCERGRNNLTGLFREMFSRPPDESR